MANFAHVRNSVLVACVIAGPMGAHALAADEDAIARFVNDDVGSIAFVDLTAVDVPAAFDELHQLLGEVPGLTAEQASAQAARHQRWIEQMKANGARRIYALGQVTAVQYNGPVWVLPLAEQANAKNVMGLMLSGVPDEMSATRGNRSEILPNVCQFVDGAVIGAMSDEQLKRFLDQRTELKRPEALAALAAVSEADAGLIAFGDADSRRVVREMLPRLPAPFMKIDGKLLADGLTWFGLLLKLPPEPTASIFIQAANDEAAHTFEESVATGLGLLKGLAMAAVASGETDVASALPAIALLKPELDGTRLSITLGDDSEEIAALRALLGPAVAASRESAQRVRRINSLKQIALAMLNYESAKGAFPAAAIYDAAGKPLLSWRVQILPFMNDQASIDLYHQFHLDEPWDSEHNRALIAKIPAVYVDPGEPGLAAEGRTTFVAPTGVGMVFDGREGTKFRAINDGTSNTILAVEVIPERAVLWTKPEDWEVDLADPLRGVKGSDGEKHGGVFAAAFCDGHVMMISDGTDPPTLKAMLTIAGGEVESP